MASARQVLDGFRSELELALTSDLIEVGGVRAKVAVGWPPLVEVQNAIAQQRAIISIYDHGPSTERSQQFKHYRIEKPTVAPTGVTIGTNVGGLAGVGTTAVITLGGTVLDNDALLLYLQKGTRKAAVSVTGNTRDTPITMATAMQDAMESDVDLSAWVTVALAGSVLTLTSLVPDYVGVSVASSNVAQARREYRREIRHVQVACWFPSESSRQLVGDLIQQHFAELQAKFGLALPNGEGVRVIAQGDAYIEEDQLRDLYRRDFMFSAEYGVTVMETLYPVVVADATLVAQYGAGEEPI